MVNFSGDKRLDICKFTYKYIQCNLKQEKLFLLKVVVWVATDLMVQ